ncbi:MAG: glycosyltransferase [Candidatus Brocadiaceae bacterium]
MSVVVPVYNARPYLERAVRSALALPEVLEVILVEDGSTDGSLELCRALARESSRVRLFRHRGGENRGAGASRNAGIRNARGRYVAFLDADDWYLPNRFDVDVPLMDADDTADGVYGAAEVRYEGVDGARDLARELVTLEKRVEPEQLLPVLAHGAEGWFCTDAVTVRRDAFRLIGLFDTGLRLGQDWAMWLKMAARLRLAPGSLEEPIAVYRRHDANRAVRRSPRWRESRCGYLSSALRWMERTSLDLGTAEHLRRELVREMFRHYPGEPLGLRRRVRILIRMVRYLPIHPGILPHLARRMTNALARRLTALRRPSPREWLSPDAAEEAPADGPLVSVIVPVYNAQDHLETAIDSALALPQDLEVVLVEDGSRDRSLEICRRYAEEHERVKLFRHPDGENRGEGASRNLGIRRARGKYVAFLDADDWYLPNRFERDVPMLESDPSIDGVYGAVRIARERGAREADLGEVTTASERIPPDELLDALLFGGRGRFDVRGITVRREVFRRAGLFDEDLVLATDSAMWLKMAATCRLVPGSIEEPVAVYRRHGGNISARDNPLWADAGCAHVSSALRWAREAGLGPEKLAMLRRRLFQEVGWRRLGGARGLRRAVVVLKRLARYGPRHPFLFGRFLRRVAASLCRRLIETVSRRTGGVRGK